jgi:hypothetical protein
MKTVNPQVLHDLPWAAPLRLAKLVIHRYTHVHWAMHLRNARPVIHMISAEPHPSSMPDPCSKAPLDCLKDRLPPAGPWNPTHLPPTTGGFQTCIEDRDRSRC